MKIGLIVPGFSAGPDDWCIPVLVDVVRELRRHVDLHVFAIRYPYHRGRYDLHGAQVHALGGATTRGVARGALFAAAYAALAAEHRRGRFDVLHGVWIDEPGFLAVMAGRLLGAPSVVSLMGGELVGFPDIGYGGRLTPSNRVLATVALRGAARVTAGCSSGMALARACLPPRHRGKVQRVVWGIDPAVFVGGASRPEPTAEAIRDEPPENSRPFTVLHVGSLLAIKDQATLLRAFARLRAAEPAARLDIAGDGPLRFSLASEATALGISEAVTFHGHVPRHGLSALYRAADVLAVSSRHEGQGVVVLEAALCGLPVAGAEVGLVADFAPDAALAVPPGDAVALADALGLLRQSDMRRSLATAACRLMRTEYLAARTADHLVAMYRQL